MTDDRLQRPAGRARIRRHRLGPAATLATTAMVLPVLLGACGVSVDESAQIVGSDEVPYDLLDSTTTSLVSADSQGVETSVCLVLNGAVLSVGRDRTGEPPLDTLLQLVLAGPTAGEVQLGLRSALSNADMVTRTTTLESMVRVELGQDFADLPGDQQLLAVAQITCTLTTQPGIDAVSFRLSGKDIEVPVGDGSIVSRPVTRTDYQKLIAN